MSKLQVTQDTPLTPVELTKSLYEGYFRKENEYPSDQSLAVLWAHTSLETARGKKIRNYNFGNIKNSNGIRFPQYDYCMYEAGEFINGEHKMFYPPHPQTHFASFPSKEEGAEAYIKFFSEQDRYIESWEMLKGGDPVKFSVALKKGGYYTAPVAPYTQVIVKLTKEFLSKPELIAWKPEPDVLLPDIVNWKPQEIKLAVHKNWFQLMLGSFKFIFNFISKLWKK